MTEIPGLRIWPPSKYPLIHEARRRFKEGGKEALNLWLRSMDPGTRAELASQMIGVISESTGRDPAEVALEIFSGKGFKL